MILVNITEGSHKAGAVYSGKVLIDPESNKRVVRLQDLKDVFGRDFDHCYLIEVEGWSANKCLNSLIANR